MNISLKVIDIKITKKGISVELKLDIPNNIDGKGGK